MNTASYDLCIEVHKLYEWDDTFLVWVRWDGSAPALYTRQQVLSGSQNKFEEVVPAYDLGYLIRRMATARHVATNDKTPENTLCKLLIMDYRGFD